MSAGSTPTCRLASLIPAMSLALLLRTTSGASTGRNNTNRIPMAMRSTKASIPMKNIPLSNGEINGNRDDSSTQADEGRPILRDTGDWPAPFGDEHFADYLEARADELGGESREGDGLLDGCGPLRKHQKIGRA